MILHTPAFCLREINSPWTQQLPGEPTNRPGPRNRMFSTAAARSHVVRAEYIDNTKENRNT
jgi:hypothetical protein